MKILINGEEASGSIQVDQNVNPDSEYAVSGKGVSKALKDKVTQEQLNGALAKYKKYVLAVGTHEVENLNNYNFITIGFINSNNNVFNTSTLPIQIFKEVLNLNAIYSYPGDNHLSANVRYVNDTSIAVSNNANWNTLIILHN